VCSECLFQSTRPRGARRILYSQKELKSWSFNPRARGGRDAFSVPNMAFIKQMFQSTRPRGARPSIFSRFLSTSGFNPRARGGRDSKISQLIAVAIVSIHAPAGGATCFFVCASVFCKVSIHAPAGGATP